MAKESLLIRTGNSYRTKVNDEIIYCSKDMLEEFKAALQTNQPIATNDWTHPTNGTTRKYFTVVTKESYQQADNVTTTDADALVEAYDKELEDL